MTSWIETLYLAPINTQQVVSLAVVHLKLSKWKPREAAQPLVPLQRQWMTALAKVYTLYTNPAPAIATVCLHPLSITKCGCVHANPISDTIPAVIPNLHPPNNTDWSGHTHVCRVVSSFKESLKDEITAMVRLAIQQEVQPLLSEISQLKSRVHHLESEMDASNQYSRRNC